MTPKPTRQPSPEKPLGIANRKLRFDAPQLRPAPRPFLWRWLDPGRR